MDTADNDKKNHESPSEIYRNVIISFISGAMLSILAFLANPLVRAISDFAYSLLGVNMLFLDNTLDDCIPDFFLFLVPFMGSLFLFGVVIFVCCALVRPRDNICKSQFIQVVMVYIVGVVLLFLTYYGILDMTLGRVPDTIRGQFQDFINSYLMIVIFGISLSLLVVFSVSCKCDLGRVVTGMLSVVSAIILSFFFAFDVSAISLFGKQRHLLTYDKKELIINKARGGGYVVRSCEVRGDTIYLDDSPARIIILDTLAVSHDAFIVIP